MLPSWMKIGGEIHTDQSSIHLLASYFIKRPYFYVFLFTPNEAAEGQGTAEKGGKLHG